MAIAIFAFKDVLMASGSLETLPATVSAIPLPPIIIFSLTAAFIPMIIGHAWPATAIVLPLMIVAIPDFAPSYVAVITLSAYLGNQLTPIHLCLPITSEYFGANMQKVIMQMLPVYAIIYAVILLCYGFVFV